VKVVVSDTSSLILLSKASVLEAASSRYEVYIPPSVEREASSPELRGKYPDASKIHALIRDGSLKVRKLSHRRRHIPIQLGVGEADAIRLFLQLKAHVLLSDDGKAIKACRMLNIPFTISPNIVMDLYMKDVLTRDQAILALEKLRLFGRYSPDIIASLLLKMKPE
jgi:predicted nucleic acid-binding protein